MPTVHSKPTIVHSRPTTIHSRQLNVHLRFAWGFTGKVAPLILFDDQRHFRAGGHTVADQLLILGTHLMLFEGRIARLIDREEVRIDGVTLGMAHASGLFESNLHRASFVGGFREHPAGLDKSIRRLVGRYRASHSPTAGLVPPLPCMGYWCATRNR